MMISCDTFPKTQGYAIKTSDGRVWCPGISDWKKGGVPHFAPACVKCQKYIENRGKKNGID